MTFNETIEYLYTRLPMFSRVGAAAYKKDLHNTRALLNALGNPQNRFKTIHVAGTNGKGSTCHILASIFQQHGYKTGLYTSPHLTHFGERIRINGLYISETFVIDFVAQVKGLLDEISPSFFELTVAMAFQYFAEEKVEVAIIETGLGGRLDSTNIIHPLLSIITNIGLDHTHLLGNTLPEIAFEKAGIIKENTPVIVGETQQETSGVFREMANKMQSELIFADQELIVSSLISDANGLTVHYTGTHHAMIAQCDLPGLYQQFNVRTALVACHLLQRQGWPLQEKIILEGIRQIKTNTGLKGRWEILCTQPTVVLDVAHNAHGMMQVEKQLMHWLLKNTDSKIHCIIGMVNDKDVAAVLSILPNDFVYYFTQPNSPRALPSEAMAAVASAQGKIGQQYSTVNQALTTALAAALPKDLVLVCGSVFLVGEVDRMLLQKMIAIQKGKG